MANKRPSAAPSVEIRLGTEPDVARCGRTMERAFFDDPVMRFLLPDDEQYAVVAPIVCRNVVRRGVAGGGLRCSPDGVAFASWEPPLGDESNDGPQIEAEPFDVGLVDIDRFTALNDVVHAHRPTEQHWYLQVLATHPDWQGQGYGPALMAAVFSIADRNDVPCYLETETPDLVAYYRRHGFEVRTEWDVPLDGPHMWGMLRPANKADEPGLSAR